MALLPGAGPVAGAGIAAGQALRPRTPQPDFQALLRGPEPGVFAKVLDIISRPLYATANVVNDLLGGEPGFSPIRAAWKGFVGEAKTTGSDILTTLGVENRWVQTIGGLGLDILLDPITYISLGTGAGARIATKTGTVSLSKVGQRALRNSFAKHQARIGSELLEAAAKRAGTTADDLVRSGQHLNVLRPAEILEQAQKIARQEVAGLVDDGARNLVDRGGFKLTLPFSEAGVIGKHLPATELTVAARGPLAAGANVAGAAWDRAVAAALAPVGRAVERIGQTGVATTLKQAFRHGTGFADVDALRQFAKGSENLYGKQFLDSLDEFSAKLRGAKLTRQQVQAVTLAAEEPGAVAAIARQMEIDFTPEMRQLTDDFGRFWKDSRALLLERGVNLPALGSGIDHEILRMQSIERSLAAKLERAGTRRKKKLNRELTKLQRRRAGLEASADLARREAAELGAAASQEAQEAAIRARGEQIEGRLGRLGAKEEIVQQRALEAQQRVQSGEEVAEILAAERAGLPKSADVPAPPAKQLAEPQRARVVERAAKAAEEAGRIKVGDRVIRRFKYGGKGKGSRKIRTEYVEVVELPSAGSQGKFKIRQRDAAFVGGFDESFVPASEIVQPGGATGRKVQAAAFRQLPKDVQQAARATRRSVENWVTMRGGQGDEVAEGLSRAYLEADELVKAGKNKEAGILRSQLRDDALRHAGDVFEVDWTTPVGEAELWAKMRPELEAGGAFVPTVKAPSPKRAQLATELRKVRRSVRRIKRQGGKDVGKLKTLQAQQAALETKLGELGPISRTATAGKARALKQKGFAKTAQERIAVRRARRLTTAIEKTKGDIRDVATLTDADLEKVRGEIKRFRAAKERVPDFVPHTLSPEARAFFREKGEKLGFDAKFWSDKDPHAMARTLVDQDRVPLTIRQVETAINDPEALARMAPTLEKETARKLKRLGQEFPAWFKEQTAKKARGLGGRIRQTLGKNQLFARFTKRAPVEDVAKFFDVDPERIFAARIPQMTKALRGADFYSGLIDPSRVGREAVRKLSLPGRLSKGKVDEALDLMREIGTGEAVPANWKKFSDIEKRMEQLAAAAGDPLPKGWQQFDNIKALKGHAFHPDIAEEVATTMGRLTSDKAANSMLRGYDKVLTLWKRWVLVAPAYVARNMLGNFANNWYANIHFNAYTKAIQVQRGKGILIAGRKWTAKQVEDLARQWDVWKGGLYGDVFAQHMNALAGRKVGKLGKAMNALPDWTFQGNSYVETNARVAHFISKLDDGMKPAEAARSVTKYLFDYGACFDEETEILTSEGWKKWDEIHCGLEALSFNMARDRMEWTSIDGIHVRDFDGMLNHWTSSRFDAMMTDNHKWVIHGDKARHGDHRRLKRDSYSLVEAQDMLTCRLKVRADDYAAPRKKYSDEFVEMVGWVLTEGCYAKRGCSIQVYQSEANPRYLQRLRVAWKKIQPREKGTYSHYRFDRETPIHSFYLGGQVARKIRGLFPDKQLNVAFLRELTEGQLRLLYEVLIIGDGHRSGKTEFFTQKGADFTGAFQALCMMIGKRSHSYLHESKGKVCHRTTAYASKDVYTGELQRNHVEYHGKIWCISTKNKTLVARRKGFTYISGNSTKFEDTVMRRLVFFYSWVRNNTALQVGQLFHEPWKVLAPARVAQEITKTADVPDDLRAIQPEWTTRILNAAIGRDDTTGDVKILTQFGLPMEDVLRLDWQELVGQVTPMLRIPVELTTGRRLGFGRGEAIEEYDRAYSVLRHLPDSIKDFIEFEEITWPNGRKSFRMNPWKLYALTNNPFSRLYTQLGKLFDERRGVGEKLLATMTGVKVSRFNERGARLRAAREQLGAALREAEQRGRVGKFTRFFGRKGRQVSEKEAGLLEQQSILGKARKKFYTERDQSQQAK